MSRRVPAWAWLAAALAGCASPPRSDLSEPWRWEERPGETVEVASAGRLLPVVTDANPDNLWAARFLADTIEETCGRRPPVLTNAADAVVCALFVGGGPEGGDGELGPEGFRVIAADGSVRFLGRADYAVFDWCERALGMRYYGVGGKCVERRGEIVVAAADYADRPAFEHRVAECGRGVDWVRVAKAGSSHRGGVAVHAPHRWFRDEALKARHPGIFETGETPMLCYGSPETLAYYRERVERHIAGLEDSGGIVDTRRKVVTVSPWDAPIGCGCACCRALRGAGASASPVVWGWFAARLAQWLKAAHPDYLLSFLPYLNFRSVPEGGAASNLGLGNAEAEVCTMPGLARLADPACRRREEGLLRGWRRLTGRKVLSWNYECWPREQTSAPYVFGRTVQAHYSAMRDVLCGAFVCGSATNPRTELSCYVWMKCLWNPDLDVERVYDEYARRMFGPAARPMRALIALQEECWERPWPDAGCTYRNVFETSFPPADVARLRALGEEAYELAAAAGEPFFGRVRRYLSGLEDFIVESKLNAARTGRLEIAPGRTHALVQARDAGWTNVWARTEVVTRREGDGLRVRVRCLEPAAARLDYAHEVPDFVWGNDRVEVFAETCGEVRRHELGLRDAICRDGESWTVEVRIPLDERARREGRVRGNVCRWRVGDRRRPESERVPGSRYEHTRLDTRYTAPNDDPAAFVDFLCP